MNNNNSQQEEEEEAEEESSIFVYNDPGGNPSSQIILHDDRLVDAITHVRLDPSVLTIQECAFENCQALVQVDLLLLLNDNNNANTSCSKLQSIGKRAFCNCSALQEIIIPHTVTRMEEEAFAWCGSLTKVTFLGNTRSQLTYIGKRVFLGTSLQSIVIPNSVEIIDEEAFDGCHLLTHLEFMSSAKLVTIGTRAFASCARLQEISIPSTVETLGSGAFAWCKSLIHVHLPTDGLLKTISDNLFERCLALEHISLPNTVETIGNRSFEYCTNLCQIDFAGNKNNNLKSIGYRAFVGCSALENLNKFSSSLASIIGPAAFAECRLLSNVHFPHSLTLLGEYAFAECTSLRSVSIPSTIKGIETGTFQGCVSLTEVQFLEGLESIGDRAFAHCQSLSAVSFPQSLSSFHACKNLLGVEFPKQKADGSSSLILTYRPPCFSACSSLVTVSILPWIMDDGEESMVHHAFSDCERLQMKKCRQEQDGPPKTFVRDRFQNLPVHDVCYHSSHTTVDQLCQALDSIANLDDEDSSNSMVDAYGMTPCHIAATSTKLRLDMFTLLLDRYYPKKILWICDCHGFSAMDYLIMHRSSRAIPLIQHALQRAIEVWMNDWGLETWRKDLLHQVEESIPWADDTETKQAQLLEVLDLLESYREMEATSTVELALWKMAMNQALLRGDEGSTVLPSTERANYRLRCGADVVLPNVMNCLWDGNSSEGVYWI